MKTNKEIIKKYCWEICEKEHLGKPKISLRYNVNTWGLCYNKLENKKIIRLSKCMLLDFKLLKKYCGVDLWSVLIHEIAHLRYSNHIEAHNKDFWNYYKLLIKKYANLKNKFYKELNEIKK